jgi:formamidopyrimidine-DNA glycosylase
MPELPEVETIVRSLRPRLVGQRVVAVETSGLALRRPIDLAQLRAACVGARVEAVRRYGKYWLIDFAKARTQQVLLGHLGMSGRLVFAQKGGVRAPHTHAVFHLSGGHELRYIDPRRFGVLRVYTREELARAPELAVLGIDPFSAAFTAGRLYELLRAAHRELKGFLMDQSRVAGLGNIYVCEALYLARLSPRRRADHVSVAGATRLHAAIGTVLKSAIRNRGTSISDYVDADGDTGDNQHALYVYGRAGEPCRRCRAPIRCFVQAGRSTYYCPRCQK